ncbi:MAG: nucleoside deaminase [Prevotella sp.]|nr:nucleoside deaminase [Prevotella sp.]
MNQFMQIAIEEAQAGIRQGHGGPFGAVIVKDGKIIGKGHNTVVCDYNPTAHGELNAIQNACRNINSFDLQGAEIYTTGEPCPMCLGAILWANISHIYYGCSIHENNAIGFRDEIFYQDLSFSTQKMQNKITQIDHDACLALFNQYAQMQNKVDY